MQARHMSASDKPLFLFDHLEGEAREEICYCPDDERNDPAKNISVLRVVWLLTITCIFAGGFLL